MHVTYTFEDLSSIPWDIIDSTNIDLMLEKWYDLFLSVVNKHLSIKQRRVKFRYQPEWFGSDIKEAMDTRDYYARVNNLPQWRVWKNKVNHLISESKSVYYKTLLEKNKNNPRAFWNFFHELIPKKTTNFINLLCQDSIVTDPKSITETFNEYFSSIVDDLSRKGVQPDLSRLQNFISDRIDTNISLQIPPVNQQFVLKKLQSLDV